MKCDGGGSRKDFRYECQRASTRLKLNNMRLLRCVRVLMDFSLQVSSSCVMRRIRHPGASVD
jgi:hypothetical protein